MAFQLEISAAAERDFELIFDHLFKSYTSFGERVQNAVGMLKIGFWKSEQPPIAYRLRRIEANVTTIFCRDCDT